MTFGPLLIHAPWALLGLALLPLLWWLIRFLPPPPRRIWFPPLRLLEGLRSATRTRIHPNHWLLLLRMMICALALLAMADVFYTKELAQQSEKDATRFIILDNGWASASGWQERHGAVIRLIDEAERDERPVLLLTTASSGEETPLQPVNAAKARLLAEGLEPLPWRSNRVGMAERLNALLEDENIPDWIEGVEPIWIDDGIEEKSDAGGSERLALALQRLGERGVAPRRLSSSNARPLLALRPASLTEDADAMLLSLIPESESLADKQPVSVEAFDSNGERLALLELQLDSNARETPLRFDLPLLSISKAAQISVRAQGSAAAVLLRGAGALRLPVALLDANPSQDERPYFSGLYYLRRALAPFAQPRLPPRGQGSRLERLLQEAPAVVILDDVARMSAAERKMLTGWVERGGILLRFAGTNTAQAQNTLQEADDLLPVRLRRDERVLGGALSWDAPRRLAPFEEESPFHGLEVPDEVTVSRQILSLPDDAGAGERDNRAQVWARLEDGSPLVSARAKGRGLLVFFHITAAPHWSELPLSGLYVEMLRRILRLSPGPITPENRTGASETLQTTRAPDAAARVSLRPFLNLDGYGVLGAPPASARAIETDALDNIQASAEHPPGFYGNAGYLEAINVLDDEAKLLPLARAGGDALAKLSVLPLEGRSAISLTPLFLWLALLLLLLDSLIALRSLRPSLNGMGEAVAKASVIAILLATSLASSASAQEKSSRGDSAAPIPEALRTVTLAYVRTGNNEVDAMSRDGLRGLSKELQARTTVYSGVHTGGGPIEPIGINLETDELAYFPLLYWPVTPEQSALSQRGRDVLADYLRHGGMVLFDTRDRHLGATSVDGGATEGERALRRLLAEVEIPPLMPASSAHALGKSFYLLDEFPGRYAGGRVWVAREEGEGGDRKVSPVVIGGHDWAAAWAINAFDRPVILPLPGRERQREMARRFGVNLVLYALTGNYKQDQVHLPILLERLAH